jgi:exodeoxyribonuclease-3
MASPYMLPDKIGLRMRITTWNVNGLRAALRKGFAAQIEKIRPDVLLLQEVRALPEQLPGEWQDPGDWHVHWNPAEKKGYSGTAVWSRKPFKLIGTGMNGIDPEGRVIHIRTGGVEILSVYLPSGSSSENRQKVKNSWLDDFRPWINQLLNKRTPVVLGGDLNIAHTEKDIFHAKSNENTSGFLPHERRWFSDVLEDGWHDLVREHYGDRHGPYSWWSNRGRARELDRGWRIDYLLGNKPASKRFKSADIHREGGLTISDHAPVSIDLD